MIHPVPLNSPSKQLNTPLSELLKTRFNELAPAHLAIIDDSAKHAGHAGSGGGGHFSVTIVSDRFEGVATLARHRAVYATVSDLMPYRVHALSLVTLSPSEFAAKPF